MHSFLLLRFVPEPPYPLSSLMCLISSPLIICLLKEFPSTFSWILWYSFLYERYSSVPLCIFLYGVLYFICFVLLWISYFSSTFRYSTLSSLYCAEVPLRNWSLTQRLSVPLTSVSSMCPAISRLLSLIELYICPLMFRFISEELAV